MSYMDVTFTDDDVVEAHATALNKLGLLLSKCVAKRDSQ